MADTGKLTFSVKHVDGVMHLDAETAALTLPSIEDVRIHPAIPAGDES